MVPRVATRFLRGGGVRVLTGLEATDWLVGTGKSLVRWGDGETAVYRGIDIRSQSSTPALVAGLARVLLEPRPDIAIGVPAGPLLAPLWHHVRRRGWLRTRLLWARHARPLDTYVDAFLFRDDPILARAIVDRLCDRAGFVIVVGPDRDDARLLAHLPCPVSWVGVAPRNCFAEITDVIAQVRAEAERQRVADEARGRGVVLISAGPAAKLMVLDLSPTLRCYDVGHFFYFQRHPAKPNVWTR